MSQTQMNQTVTMSEIADAAGVSKPTASIWRTRYRDTFPDPLPESSPNRPLFALAAVEQWYREQFPDRTPLGLAQRSISTIHHSMVSVLRGTLDVSDAAAVIVGLLAWHALAHDAELKDDLTWNGVTISANNVPAFPRTEHFQDRRFNDELLRATDQLCAAGLDSIALLIEPLSRESHDHRWTERTESLLNMVTQLGYTTLADVADALLTNPQVGYSPSPPALADLLAGLVHQDHSTVWDPSVGVGTLLAAAHRSAPKSHLTGTDISPIAAALTTARAYLNDWPATITVGDAFLKPPNNSYDAIVIDPPLGTRLDPHATELLSRQLDFPPIPSSRSEIGWVCLAAARLTADMGAAAIVTGGSATFTKGAVADVRRALVTNGYVEAIIRLPRRATTSPSPRNHRQRHDFRYDTSVDLYIWVIKPRDSFDSVIFIDGEQLLGATEGETIANIIGAVEDEEKPSGTISVKSLDVLKRPDVPLNPDAWLPQDEVTAADYLTTLRASATLLETSINELRFGLPDLTLVNAPHPLRPLTDVAEVIRSRPIPREGIQEQPGEGLVPIVKSAPGGLVTTGYAADDDSARHLRAGDVLVNVGSSGTVAGVWRGNEAAIASPTTTVVRVDPTRMDADFVRLCMLGPNVTATLTGTTIPRLNLHRAAIPDIPISQQRAITAAVERGQNLLDQFHILQSAAAQWVDSAASLASLGTLEVHQETSA